MIEDTVFYKIILSKDKTVVKIPTQKHTDNIFQRRKKPEVFHKAGLFTCCGSGGTFSSVLGYFILLKTKRHQRKKSREDWRSNDRQRNSSNQISEK